MGFCREAIDRLHHRGLTGAGVAIGQLDTGVDGSHPAFDAGRTCFRRFGYRGFSHDGGPAVDSGWHGTHTAGLMVGAGVGDPHTGIAPDARLLSGAVVEEGNVIARILAGLDWLLDNDVGVVNLSLGLFCGTPAFRSLIRTMVANDVVVVSPIGNRGAGQASVPGLYPECLTVGAVDDNGLVAPFSGSANRADTVECIKPDVLAPGVDIMSSMPGGGYEAKTGTSAASAIVSGMAALLRAAFPAASGSVVRQVLIESCGRRSVDQHHRSAAGPIDVDLAYARLDQGQHDEVADRPDSAESERHLDPLDEFKADRYLDPRLEQRLTSMAPDRQCEAVLEFDDWEPVAALREEVGDGEESWTELRHRPIVICRAPRTVIDDVLEWPSLRIASACDIDHFL